MATRHDSHNRCPVRSALLKWQLKQDEQRVAEVQHRLMRMTAPSPASSLRMNSGKLDRRVAARRPRPVYDTDQEKGGLRTFMLMQDEQERNAVKRSIDLAKASNFQHPLSPSKRLMLPSNNSVKSDLFCATPQKLNAGEDCDLLLRLQGLQHTGSDIHQTLTFSTTEAATPKYIVGKSAAPTPRDMFQYDEIKTLDRRRMATMGLSQEEVHEMASAQWQEKRALQADKLVVEAARDRDDEALWNDVYYRTNAVERNDLSEQPDVYSTNGFLERLSCSRSNLRKNSSYENGDTGQPTFPTNLCMGDNGMISSEISTMSISDQTKQFTRQSSDIKSSAIDANEFSTPASGQSIAELLASMDGPNEDEDARNCKAGDDELSDLSSDRKQYLRGDFSADGARYSRAKAFFSTQFPQCSLIVVVCCLVIGTSGFFIEELIAAIGLFSKRTQVLVSKVEQERMRDRVSILEHEVRGFQLLTSMIEVRSQAVLTELRQYVDRMRLNRLKHQNMLAKEMQDLRRHILNVTHELVKQEQESLRTQVEDIVRVQGNNVESAGDNNVIAGAGDTENDKNLENIVPEVPSQSESYQAIHESLHDTIVSSPASTYQDHGEQFRVKQFKANQQLATKDNAAMSVVQHPHGVDSEQVHIQFAEDEHVPVKALSQSMTGEIATDQESKVKPESPHLVHELNVEHQVSVQSASLLAREPSTNKIDAAVASASTVTIDVIPSHNASGMSWDIMLLLVGIAFLVACIVLRLYSTNRRERWFEKRRKRRNQRALRLAQQRARAMAKYQEDSDEWHCHEMDDDIEEVSLMTPIQDNEDDESTT
ncbi:unnamed protein product [Peronospora belbahrii]|uniref:Uncharacterized protein n=1 Tax=Peronospora belbahrii TaxID=622444 RepID=A0ABN8CZ42_9STRA|nr:unnamed protein product [Peronospora belbahrii]